MSLLFASTSDWGLPELEDRNRIQMTQPSSNMKCRAEFRKRCSGTLKGHSEMIPALYGRRNPMRKFLTLPLLLLAAVLSISAQTKTLNPRAEIEAFNRRFEDATKRMDNAAIVALWADDGIRLLPSAKQL